MKNSILILISFSIIRGFAGPIINNSQGLFFKALADEFNTKLINQALYLSFSSFSSVVSLLCINKILTKIKIENVIYISIILQSSAFFLLGFMNNIVFWYILALPIGIGVGVLVNFVGPIIVNDNYKDKKGIYMGVMLCTTSIIGAVAQPILSYIISVFSFRVAYISFGGVSFVVSLLLAKLIKIKNTPIKQKEENKVKLSKQFYLICFFVLAITSFVSFSQHIAVLGQNEGYSLNDMGVCLFVCMLGSAIGALIIGYMSDKINPITTAFISMAVGVIVMILFLFFVKNYIILLIACFFNGIIMSSLGVLPSLISLKSFSKDEYKANFSKTLIANPLGACIFMPLYAVAYDYLNNYDLTICFIIGILTLAMISLLLIKKTIAENID